MDICSSQTEDNNQVVAEDMVTVEDVVGMTSSLDNCLFLNKVYQELIADSIQRLETILAENREQQQILQRKLNESSEPGRPAGAIVNQKYKHNTVFCYPYFKNKAGFLQPPNEDTKAKVVNNDLDPYLRPPKQWNSAEKKQLLEAVKATALQKTLQPLLIKKESLHEKLSENKQTEEEKKEILMKISKTEELLDKKNFSEEFLAGPINHDHDWLKISTIDFEGKRTPNECELMWKNLMHPLINRRKWTPEEDVRLQELAAANDRDWDSIALTLGTRRTSLQCIERFQSNFNQKLVRSIWTREEDEKLKKLIESCRIGDFIPWHQVSHYMEGRTRCQVSRRWHQRISPDVIKGKWTVKEDVILLAAVTKYDYDWKQVSIHVPGRTNAQCRERFTNTLDWSISCQPWTAEEDEQVMRLAELKNRRWSEIARHFQGRTDGMIAKRYSRLMAVKEETNSEEKKKFESLNHSEANYPKSYSRKKLYRLKIYKLLLKQLQQLEDNTAINNNNTLNLNQMKETLKFINREDLDGFLKKFQKKMRKRPRPAPVPKRVQAPSAEDRDLINYFTNVMTHNKKGRPTLHMKKIQTSESIYNLMTISLLQTLQSQVKSNEIKSNLPSQCDPCVEIGIQFLAPTSATISAMKTIATNFSPSFVYDIKKSQSSAAIDANQCKLLFTRFVSTFFWPVFLSHIPVSENSLENSVSSSEIAVQNNRRKRKRPQKRAPKKPWVSKRMKQLAEERWHKSNEGENREASNSLSATCSVAVIENSVVETETERKEPKRGRPFGSKNKKKEELSVNETRKSVRLNIKKNPS